MIRLRLLRRPDGVDPGPGSLVLKVEGSTVGRSADCDLVLDDPLRLVSRRHAWLAPHGEEAALLRCISTSAALTVNGRSMPPGAECLVRGGDSLRIGGFELVLEAAEERVAGAASTPAPARVAAVAPVVPVAPVTPLKTPAPMATVEPLLARAARAVPVEPTLRAEAPAVPAPQRPAPSSPVVLASVPSARRGVEARESRLDQWFDLDTVADPLGPGSPLPALDGVAPVRPAPIVAAAAAVDEVPRTVLLERATSRPVPLPPEPPRPTIAKAPLASAPTQPPAAPASEAASFDPETLRRAFLRGAGLDGTAAFKLDAAVMEHLGALLRTTTEGTIELLRSRAVAKRNIRAEGTQIVARQNNPLKFAPDAAQALTLLLSVEARRGFLEPLDALHDAYHDLQMHQLAMVAGMRAAVLDLMSRLGPEAIEAAEGPAHGIAAGVPALHDAALWRRHRQGHEKLMANLDDVFEATFGREFRQAYEAQSKSPFEDSAAQGLDKPA